MAKGEKTSFIMQYDYKETFEALGADQAYQLLMAIFEYEETQNEPEFSGILKIAWIPIRQNLDKNRTNWEKTSEERKRAGAQGGRGNKKDESKKSNCFTEKQSEAKKAKKADSDCECDCGCECEEKNDMPPVGSVPDGTHHHDPLSPTGHEPEKQEPATIDQHQALFDHYLTLGLIKHKTLTPEMRNAIDVARRRCKYDWLMLHALLDRHAQIVELTKDNEMPVRPRPLAEFFGQKVRDGTMLICSEYADDGQKWLRYKDGNVQQRDTTQKRESFERPVGKYDHLAVDLFGDKNSNIGSKPRQFAHPAENLDHLAVDLFAEERGTG